MENVSLIELIVFGVIAFVAAILSGISGAGAGFINTPLLIFFGLSPAQAISSGKLTGLAVSIGALKGMQRVKIRSVCTLVIIMLIALVVGLIAPHIIVSLESDIYRKALGIILLLMAPLLLIKKIGTTSREVGAKKRGLGFAVVTATLSLQAVFSGGLGTFVNVALMSLLGMSALEANVVKRYSQLVMNSAIVIGVFATGLIIWPVAFVGIAASLAGGYAGGKLAFKKGDAFVMKIFVTFMLVSGLYLLFG